MDGFGASPEELLHRAGVRQERSAPPPPRPGTPCGRLRLLNLSDCAATKRWGYIVKGVFAPGDLIVLFGPPGTGKSALAPYIAHAVAAGRRVFGRRVRRGPVLYIAAEDGAGMRMRAVALRGVHGDAPGLWIVAEPVDLSAGAPGDPPDLEEIRAAARRVGAVLVIVDTLAMAFPGLRENEAEDMGRAVRVLRELGRPERDDQPWIAVMAVHHGTKEGGRGPRGHSVLNGAADVTLEIVPPPAACEPRLVVFGKNRNGPADATLAFTVRGERIGTDEDGEAETAPIAEEAAHEAPTGPAQPPMAKRALRMLADLIAREGKPLPVGAGFPAGLSGIPEGRWWGECHTRRLSAATKEAERERAIRREIQRLYTAGAAAVRDGLVWVCHPERDA
ncbi:hypothetical protein GCM10009416_07170 [Craurococcus roseus]|uniref:AAA+ ATPase domain-containing protein n=1 Tax=Craurococcus roseus TaxID=77585 RepID=A0ABP3PTP3_9PROT